MTSLRSIALVAAFAMAFPAFAQEVVVTNPRAKPAPASTSATAATTASKDPTADAAIVPRGAPVDDYEFVGWCSGILTGHMDLFRRVKPELDAISKRWGTLAEDEKDYVEQRAAGQKAQALFAHAMRAAEAASSREIKPRGQAAIASGLAMWSEIDTVDATNQAYSWLNWGLPARCEKVAGQLEARATLAAVTPTAPAVAPAATTPSPTASKVTKPTP